MSVNIHVYTCSAVLIWRLYGHHTIVHQDCTHLRALRWGGEREGGGEKKRENGNKSKSISTKLISLHT